MSHSFDIAEKVRLAIESNRPIVALESALITHGLPWPMNVETARAAEAAVRAERCVPATIAVLEGQLRIGLTDVEIERLARPDAGALKASRRDLAAMIVQGRSAGTTVAATLFLAHQAGIRVFATGGIGGVHRDVGESLDISADLFELARTPVCVVCSGVKSILDIAKTLEMLETLGVPVVGYGIDVLPAFYVRSSGEKLDTRVDSPEAAARLVEAHWQLGGAGIVIAQPPPAEQAMTVEEFEHALTLAEKRARENRIRGKAITPFLLGALAEITEGKTLAVNRELIVANAHLAARIARTLG